MTDRIPRPKEWPPWVRKALAAGAVALPSAIVGGASVVWGVGLAVGSSTVRLDAADMLSQRNHQDITELQRRVDASDARAEERHRAIMRMLQTIESRLDR